MASQEHYLGEGGQVITFDLPLPEAMQQKVTRGQLRRVNADGSPFTEPSEAKRPGKNASKDDWVGYAVSQGMDLDEVDAMTKADLIELLS